jgi:hypothetical protein
MGFQMSRLIIIPQYPAKLRYQEWWIREFTEQYSKRFSQVITICPDVSVEKAGDSLFSPIETAIAFETQQIMEYMELPLLKDDILLLNDLSFPGLFGGILFHKRPSRCFAICHATAKNRYDLFQPVRTIKYPIEKMVANLFDAVFVGSEYHAKKLGWKNVKVTKLPNYPTSMEPNVVKTKKKRMFACASRPGIQKVNRSTEALIHAYFGFEIHRPIVSTWSEYFEFLQETKFLLITAKEETYGYQVIDALMNGCIPLAPNDLSYPELLDQRFLYNDPFELIDIIEKYKNRTPLLEKPKEAFFDLTSKIMQGE